MPPELVVDGPCYPPSTPPTRPEVELAAMLGNGTGPASSRRARTASRMPFPRNVSGGGTCPGSYRADPSSPEVTRGPASNAWQPVAPFQRHLLKMSARRTLESVNMGLSTEED